MTKKSLIELMLENNIEWPEGAEFAAQDKESNTGDLCVQFYEFRPYRPEKKTYWIDDNGTMLQEHRANLPELCRNWHQAIVTREQYEAAIAARGATIISTHSVSEVVSKISDCERHDDDVYSVDISDSDDETVIVEYLDVDSIINKIAHHQAESQRHEEAMLDHNDKELALRDQLNEMLAKVGMVAIDKSPADKVMVSAATHLPKNNGWPDYCDENGIVVDWDKVPEGSEVECIHAESLFFGVGCIYKVGTSRSGNFGPLNSFRDTSTIINYYKFRLIK